MRYALMGAIGLLGFASAAAITAGAQTVPLPLTGDATPKSAAPETAGPGAADHQATPAPGRRADTSVPPSGVVHPAPDATEDTTVKPPNVDPKMAIAPPGTPGSGVKVNPK
jgi:hypothetical protein